MTRASKKEAERHVLDAYLRHLDTHIPDDRIIHGERPDFLLKLPDGDIGVEVTDFHASGNRREVEELWNALQAFAQERSDRPIHRGIYLHFREVRMPPKKEFGSFCQELFLLASRDVTRDTPFPVSDSQHPTMAKYVHQVDVRALKADVFIWGSNLDGGWIGAPEDELVEIVTRKFGSTSTPASEHWLIIAQGASISRMMGFIDHQCLEVMRRLTRILQDGPFNRLVLLQNPVIEWRQESGWASL